MGGVATAIVSKVFDVVGKLLQCQFNDGFVKVWFRVSLAGILFHLDSYRFFTLQLSSCDVVKPKRSVYLH